MLVYWKLALVCLVLIVRVCPDLASQAHGGLEVRTWV